MNFLPKKCSDCSRVQTSTNDVFLGERCHDCWKRFDNSRGVFKRYFCRVAKGKIKPSSEVTPTRTCGTCRESKETGTSFYFKMVRGRSIPDRECKACKYKKSSEFKKKNSSRYAAYAKSARKRDPARHKAQRVNYRKNLGGWIKDREYAKAHRDLTRRRARDYAKTPEGRVATLAKRQKERLKKTASTTANSVHVTGKWIASMFLEYDLKCAYCGNVLPLTIDHVVPVSRGGLHERANIVPSCFACNSSKCDKPVNKWRPSVVIPCYGLELASG